jgi:outer membrane lipoprotein-sorting protein
MKANRMRYKIFWMLGALLLLQLTGMAQDAETLLKKVRAKMDKVNDYVATGKMKTDVVFIKAPISNIRAYFRKPDRFAIKRDNGISLLPKSGVSVNISSLLLTEDFTAIDAGTTQWQQQQVRLVKLLPLNEQSDVVLTTLYIDEKNLLIRKANTTTRESGTFEMELDYGRYSDWGLPDKVVFSFNTKDYKLPKGITFEYDDGSTRTELPKNKKGRVEITYSSYTINKGVPDQAFR